jgi:hypothetical protein
LKVIDAGPVSAVVDVDPPEMVSVTGITVDVTSDP